MADVAMVIVNIRFNKRRKKILPKQRLAFHCRQKHATDEKKNNNNKNKKLRRKKKHQNQSKVKAYSWVNIRESSLLSKITV